MPLFKLCDCSRAKRKAVVASSIEELITKGRKKLCLSEDEECQVFEDRDGTEVDDDECLLAYDPGTVFMLGAQWQGASARSRETKSTTPLVDTTFVEEKELATEKGGGEKANRETDSVEGDTISDTVGEKGENNTSVPEKDTSKIKEGKEKRKSFHDVLMRDAPYKYAKMKNMKIFTPAELESVPDMERRRRQFWNEKAEELAKSPKTGNQSKMALQGIIDVSWTLRKTSLLEAEATQLLQDQKVLFEKEEIEGRKLGLQKKDTIHKNLERMAAAHSSVEGFDEKMAECKKSFTEAERLSERKRKTTEYGKLKNLMDGAYTELKRAQDALAKSVKVKRNELENRLRKRDVDLRLKDAASSSTVELSDEPE